MESVRRMSLYQLARVESNDTAVGSGIFCNPKYEIGEGSSAGELDHFNLQLTKDQGPQVNNDLTGNTMKSEASAGAMVKGSTGNMNTVFEDYLDLEALQNSRRGRRRLSISGYNVDNAGYYEYEYFGKNRGSADGVNEDTSTSANNNNKSNYNSNNGNDEEEEEEEEEDDDDESDLDVNRDDVVMVSDGDWVLPRNELALQMGANNELFDFVSQTQGLEVSSPEDYNFEVDAPLIDQTVQQPPKKKVKDYFKLNIFGSSNNNNSNNNNNNTQSGELVLGEEPIFKKRYFWNRNPIKRRTRSDADLFGMPAEEDCALVNPSQLVASSECDDDADSHMVAESLTRCSEFDSLDAPDKFSSAASTVAPTARAASMSAASTVVPCSTFPSPLMRRKFGSMPKTRGRKPSPIPDASKHFGCEYCDRRFKRQEHLKRHVRSLHMCEKPFGCPVCGKKFSRSDNLNQHIKTHTHQQ